MDLNHILSIVCTTTNIRKELILGRSKKGDIVSARFIYFYLARKHTTHKAADIYSILNRKKTDYFHALNKVDEWRKHNVAFKSLLETINSQILLSKF